MKLMMKMDELEETLESQEELLRLERETSKTLDKNLAIERKENKRIKESLKTNDNILLEVRELLTSEREKVDDLTKKYSLVEDTNANLRSENIKLQESFTSLQAIHKHLRLSTTLLWRVIQKLVRNLVHPFHQQIMVVHVVIILIFKFVLLTMLR